jgi:hypothetical protein
MMSRRRPYCGQDIDMTELRQAHTTFLSAQQVELNRSFSAQVLSTLASDNIAPLVALNKQGFNINDHPDLDVWLQCAVDNMAFNTLRYFRAQGVVALPLLSRLHSGSVLRKTYNDSKDSERVRLLLSMVLSPKGQYAKTALALLCFERDVVLRRYMPEDLTVAECLKSASTNHCRDCENSLVNVIAFGSLSTAHVSARPLA